MSWNPHWCRPPRTRAAALAKFRAINKAAHRLDYAQIEYTQPLPGKLVIEPPPGLEGGSLVIFWPARERVRIGRRQTKTGQDIHAFEQALADQGHRVPGYFSRCLRPPEQPAPTNAEQRRECREATLAELDDAIARSMAVLRQKVDDMAAERRRTGGASRSPQATRRRKL